MTASWLLGLSDVLSNQRETVKRGFTGDNAAPKCMAVQSASEWQKIDTGSKVLVCSILELLVMQDVCIVVCIHDFSCA